jgi:hypothetical protein
VTDPVGSERLTDALLAPLTSLDATAWGAALEGVPENLSRWAARRAAGGPWRLTDYQIRRALSSEEGGSETPFAWSTRTARRALGLAGLQMVLAGDARSPVEGVRAAVARAAGWAGEEGHPRWGMERWLAELPAPGRAAVGAEAVTWATRLWCALDWKALTSPIIIGRDHWWESPHSSLLALRSRADVRTGAVHLVCLSGPRRHTVRAELSVVALVEALRSPGSAAPGRVVGWWPDSGHLVRVDMEPAVLATGMAAVGKALLGGSTGAAA